jgi:hypothetical protein
VKYDLILAIPTYLLVVDSRQVVPSCPASLVLLLAPDRAFLPFTAVCLSSVDFSEDIPILADKESSWFHLSYPPAFYGSVVE